MVNQILSPTSLVADGAGLDITALLAAPTQATLQFANTGKEFLVCLSSTAGITVTVNVGTTVLGQSVTSFTAVTLTSGHLTSFGQFHNAVNGSIAGAGSNNVTVTLSGTANIQVALLSSAGVY